LHLHFNASNEIIAAVALGPAGPDSSAAGEVWVALKPPKRDKSVGEKAPAKKAAAKK
jgi:hypothetical protein